MKEKLKDFKFYKTNASKKRGHLKQSNAIYNFTLS